MKHIAIIPIMLLALAATAQTKATVEHGAESKKTTAQYMATARQIGTYEGLNCWVGTAKDERLTVTLTDHNLEPMRSMELPEGADMRVLATTIDGNKARLLLAEEGYRNMTLIYTASIDLDSMRPEAGTLPLVQIDSVGYGKKDDCKVWGAASANGGHLGYVLIVEYKDRKQYSARTVVLDRQLKEEWNKEFAMGSMDEIAVADDGTVVTLGYEEEGEMTHFIFNVIGARKADSYDVAVKCDPVRELHLAGVTGRYAMGMGLFRPDGSKPDENLTGGVIGMAFQIDYAELSGFVMRPFQNEDLNILENKKTKKIQREQMMDYVSMNALTLTDFGAVIAAGRNYQRTYSEDNGLTSNEYHRMGLHMMAIDTDPEAISYALENGIIDEGRTEVDPQMVRKADVIIFGIGSLYTSIMPNVIIKQLKAAINESNAKKIYLCNAMTQHGETDGYSLEDHVKAIEKHLEGKLDIVVRAKDKIPEECLKRYEEEYSYPVEMKEKTHRYRIVSASLLSFENGLIRHDPDKITRVVERLIGE